MDDASKSLPSVDDLVARGLTPDSARRYLRLAESDLTGDVARDIIDRVMTGRAPLASEPLKRVAELEGAELDAWVVRALGAYRGPYQMVEDGRPEKDCLIFPSGVPFRATTGDIYPSERWSDGGPIIERDINTLEKTKVEIRACGASGTETETATWAAITRNGAEATGPTPLIAAMRAFVASKFGETVEAQP